MAVVAGVGVIRLAPASAAAPLLSQGRIATASSVENPDYTPASAAFDGSLTTTRWASAASDSQWLMVDLGSPQSLSQVVLRWESAFATGYRLETSVDKASWSTVYSTVTGKGGVETIDVPGASGRYVRFFGTKRATGYGYSLWEMQVYGAAGATPTATTTAATFKPNLDAGESITVPAGSYPTTYSTWQATPGNPTHKEFQAQCTFSHHAGNDPIVFPSQANASHDHTFVGNRTTDAFSTTGKLFASATSCTVPGDHSAYWFPSLLNGAAFVAPNIAQTIYYKSGVSDYRSVVPFPKGLRFVAGSPANTMDQFRQSPGTVQGWECGESTLNWDFPAYCTPGSQLNVRFQAPSCWDGKNLDVPDHKSHMMYPVDGHCTPDHPVALPMLEFKIAFPVSGDMSQVKLASGRGYSWHYDFFNAWDPATQRALVTHCINGGLQCDPRGYDQYKPERGYALDANGNPIL